MSVARAVSYTASWRGGVWLSSAREDLYGPLRAARPYYQGADHVADPLAAVCRWPPTRHAGQTDPGR
jgi:hypothetical protein